MVWETIVVELLKTGQRGAQSEEMKWPLESSPGHSAGNWC